MEKKEAMKVLKDFHDKSALFSVRTALDTVLPELKESEDERIKKEFCKDIWTFIPNEKAHKYIAWLEKQSEQKYTKKDVDDAYLKGISDTKNEIEKQYEANYQIRKDIATFIFNYKGDIKDRAKWMNYLGIKVSFVEKQGEQNYKFNGIAESRPVKGTLKDLLSKVEEPKFKVKDWISNGRYTKLIVGINSNWPYYMFEDGTSKRIKDIDKKYHLWTIQDAKCGDVLTNKNGSIFIFKEEYMAGKPTAYCGLVDGVFHVGDGGCWTNEKCYPATKEQRNLLFSKMKKAGWSWNDETKELSQSKDTFGDVEQKVFEDLLDNGEQLWSEEDERLCQCLIRDQEKALDEVRNDKYGHSEIISDLKEMYHERIDWLESLKQRLNK